jgi:hypothetical protein
LKNTDEIAEGEQPPPQLLFPHYTQQGMEKEKRKQDETGGDDEF